MYLCGCESMCIIVLFSPCSSLLVTITTTSIWRLFSRTSWVSRHKERYTILEFTGARDDGVSVGCQWHQLDHMQIICTSLETDNHASTSPLSFYRLNALPAAQLTASEHWRQHCWLVDRNGIQPVKGAYTLPTNTVNTGHRDWQALLLMIS